MADMLSQDEIDALLGGGSSSSAADEYYEAIDDVLSDMEKDAIGEISNINMGTASTTLFTLLNQKVTITTPHVEEITIKKLTGSLSGPCVVVVIRYKAGISGMNLLVLKEQDVKIITDLMMGGDGIDVTGELTDLHLSAINEAMNQMIGSSSTSMSDLLKTKIDICPPESIYSEIADLDLESLGIDMDEHFVKISFKMTVGDIIDSEMMQLIPVQVAQQIISSVMPQPQPEAEPVTASDARPADSGDISQDDIDSLTAGVFAEAPGVNQPDASMQAIGRQAADAHPGDHGHQMGERQNAGYAQPGAHDQTGIMAGGPNQGSQPHPGVYQQPAHHSQPVNAMPFQFDSFDSPQHHGVQHNAEIELIKDVPLEITVELGRTKRKISDILDFGIGTVVELDKIVGESLDILANGKKIARGEVVVVDENYGIRITEINTQEKKA